MACSDQPATVSTQESGLTEIKRDLSEDRQVEAVLVRSDGGTLVATGDLVFLVLPGTKITRSMINEASFRADYAENLDVKWLKDKRLLISYDKARIFHFSNFWHSGEISNWNYMVELAIKPANLDKQLSTYYD